MEQTGSRRDRLRAATVREITQTARRILVEDGPMAVTLRAIARDMGMTAPALYRYFNSHEELLRRIVGEIFNALTDDLETALCAVPDGDMSRKLVVACFEFRRWALAHRREYELLFGSPLPGLEIDKDDFAAECGRRFGQTFLNLFLRLWREKPFPIPADDEIDPLLLDQLTEYRAMLGTTELPIGVMVIFLGCWIRLQGFVTLEVFDHMAFAVRDATPMFELMLADMAPALGLEYQPRTFDS